MKNMLRALALVLAMCMLCTCFAFAEGDTAAEALDTAYLMYADSSWTYQYWGGDAENGVVATTAAITGNGEYTVGLDFTATEQGYASGLAFAAVGIVNGETTMPGSYINVTDIKVNGESVAVGIGYTSSDDGVTTRENIYNEWVTDLPTDARRADGNTAAASPIIVDKEAFAEVKTVEVTFTLQDYCEDDAYVMFASSDWAVSNWGTESADPVTVTAAHITGKGDYTVRVDSATAFDGVAFLAVGIVNGEKTFAGSSIEITEIKVNDQAIEFTKGYTSSDDGICTRMNIYNEWVAELPEDAHSYDGDLEGASAIMVDPAAFAGVTSIEVTFTLHTPSAPAYIAYASSDWAVSNWDANSDDTVTVQPVTVEGPGSYTTSVEFPTPGTGVAFVALYLEGGETAFPGYYLDITEIAVNGEPIELTGKGYTTSDDGITTRENIYNEWVTDLPADARRADGEMDGASAIIVDTAAFESVSSIQVTFNVVYGVPAATEDETITADQAKEMIANGFNAYIGVQGKDTYVFRNAWNDSYGRDDADHPYFYQLTGWDDSKTWAESNGFTVEATEDGSVNMGGTFEDAAITGDGTYTVSLTTGDLGFGATESFNLLYVSTDIPSALVNGGFVSFSDVTCKIGDSKTVTMEHEYLDVSGDYVSLRLLDSYNFADEPFGYTVPGANTAITITFTVTMTAE